MSDNALADSSLAGRGERASSMLDVLVRANAAAAAVAAVLMWALVSLVCIDVSLRALGAPILWSSEVTVYLLVSAVFLGMGYTYDRDGHFAIALVVEKLPRKGRLSLELLMVLLSLLFAGLLAWGGVGLVQFARSLSMSSPTLLHVPMFIPYSAVCVGGASLCMSLVVRAAVLAEALRTGRDVAVRTEHSI